ncbi:MAG TPA: hypothetical protein VFE17_02670 [Candidatus Baltobacteraceae bacterium]|jgi:hypothetical protein|nr:hypothetical protein [Candidatus Baltobacteraceae bacterium]
MPTAALLLPDLKRFLGEPHVTLSGTDVNRFEWPCGCVASALDGEDLYAVRWCIDHDGGALQTSTADRPFSQP